MEARSYYSGLSYTNRVRIHLINTFLPVYVTKHHHWSTQLSTIIQEDRKIWWWQKKNIWSCHFKTLQALNINHFWSFGQIDKDFFFVDFPNRLFFVTEKSITTLTRRPCTYDGDRIRHEGLWRHQRPFHLWAPTLHNSIRASSVTPPEWDIAMFWILFFVNFGLHNSSLVKKFLTTTLWYSDQWGRSCLWFFLFNIIFCDTWNFVWLKKKIVV